MFQWSNGNGSDRLENYLRTEDVGVFQTMFEDYPEFHLRLRL